MGTVEELYMSCIRVINEVRVITFYTFSALEDKCSIILLPHGSMLFGVKVFIWNAVDSTNSFTLTTYTPERISWAFHNSYASWNHLLDYSTLPCSWIFMDPKVRLLDFDVLTI